MKDAKTIHKDVALALKSIKQAGQQEREGLRNSIRHSLINERRQCREVEARILASEQTAKSIPSNMQARYVVVTGNGRHYYFAQTAPQEEKQHV